MVRKTARILVATFVLLSFVGAAPAMGVTTTDADATDDGPIETSIGTESNDCPIESQSDGVTVQCSGGGGGDDPCNDINDPYWWC